MWERFKAAIPTIVELGKVVGFVSAVIAIVSTAWNVYQARIAATDGAKARIQSNFIFDAILSAGNRGISVDEIKRKYDEWVVSSAPDAALFEGRAIKLSEISRSAASMLEKRIVSISSNGVYFINFAPIRQAEIADREFAIMNARNIFIAKLADKHVYASAAAVIDDISKDVKVDRSVAYEAFARANGTYFVEFDTGRLCGISAIIRVPPPPPPPSPPGAPPPFTPFPIQKCP